MPDRIWNAAEYTRLSRDDGDKAESNSITSQKEIIRDYVRRHPEFVIVKEYADDGYSGVNFERPGFKQMMEDIKAKKIDCVICKDLSRFARNYIDAGRYLEKIFPFMGVRFIAINDNYDSCGEKAQSDALIVPFKNLINDAYCRDISVKIRSQLDIKRKMGDFIGAFAPYGYRKDEANRNRLVVDEEAARTVELIFRLRIQGLCNSAIADRLNSMGILSPMEYKQAQGFKHHPGYVEMIDELVTKFPLSEERITGEQKQKEFIVLFGAILRMRNLLTSFDEFAGHEILSERDLQDYLGRYQDLRDEWKNKQPKGDKEDITDDIVFEIELIKQIEINIDYILMLVQKYHDSHCDDKEVLITIRKAVDASPELRSKKALIESFIAGINDVSDVMVEWRSFVAEQRESDLQQIIEEEKLKPEETRKFIETAFRDGSVKTTGTDIDKLMPPITRFGGGNRAEKKQGIIAKLLGFFEKYFGIG